MLGALAVHLLLEIELAAALVHVDGAEGDAKGQTLGGDEGVNLVADEEDEHNWGGEVADEEGLGIEIWSSDRLVGMSVGVLSEGGGWENLRRGRRRRWQRER